MARGDSSPDELLPKACRETMPFSKRLKRENTTSFAKSPPFQRAHVIDESIPSPQFQEISSVPHRHSSLLFQLRAGRVPLNKHLHSMKRVDSPMYPKCHSREETVHYLLLMCPAYSRQRRIMDRHLVHGARSLKSLLAHRKAIPHMLNFVNSTRKLDTTFGETSVPT